MEESKGGEQRRKRKGGGKDGGKKGGRRGRQESSRQPAMRSHKETGRTRTTNLVIQWLGHSVLPCERGCLWQRYSVGEFHGACLLQ